MKKVISCIMILAMITGIFSVSASAIDVDKVVMVSSEHKSVIALPDMPTSQESYAANTLKKYIKQITGIALNIVTYSKDITEYAFLIGNVNFSSDLDEGCYTITEKDSIVSITGGGLRGTIYGVYTFLEKYCDCHWYAYNLELIPAAETISVPKNLEYSYKPYFEYTETDWKVGQNLTFKVANGVNGATYGALPKEMGDSVKYISNFCHTLTTQFCAKNKYFESHPEYYALVDGKRKSTQLCLTNPDVLKIVTDEVLDLCRRSHDPSQALQIISLTQDDNQEYCTCDKCKALDKANGSQSGTMLTFVNEVAKAVKEAGFDNIGIDTFAYQYTRKAPSKVVPEKNVIIRLCSIECCFGHTLDDPDCKENVNFMNDLREWAKICDRLYIWDYTTNYSETYNIFPDFGTLQKNMQIFYENHVKGIYEEGAYYINECDGEFADLRMYLICKLMQNPYMDYDAEMNGFLKAYYGNGWKDIREFIDICTENAVTSKKHLTIGQAAKGSLSTLKQKDIKHCDELWENAKALAQNEICYNNVERSEICWRYWKCANRKSEFGILKPLHSRMKAQENLYNDMRKYGAQKIGEGTRMRDFTQCKSMILLRIPFKWTTRYDHWFWQLIDPAVLYLYNFFDKIL